jgi:hypothetical protein
MASAHGALTASGIGDNCDSTRRGGRVEVQHTAFDTMLCGVVDLNWIERGLGVSVRVFPERIDYGGRCPKCGGAIQ